MIKLRKLIAPVGAFALMTSLAFAGFYNQNISSNSYYNGSVTIPSTANGGQWGGAYSSYTISNGPYGNYTVYAGTPNNTFSVSGPVAPGTYNVLLLTNGSGYAGVSVSW